MATVKQSARDYSDFSLFFTKHPNTNDVNIIKNVESVKQSIKNLLLTRNYEKLFHPEIGCQIHSLLFETYSPVVSSVMTNTIQNVLERYEPRIRVIHVNVIDKSNQNEVDITVTFALINSDRTFTVTTTLTSSR